MILEKNMQYKIINRSEKVILKDIQRIPKKYLQKIFEKLELLSNNWIDDFQIKKLNNYKLCDYRLRVWDFRILFNLDVEKNEIIIFRILHRSKLY